MTSSVSAWLSIKGPIRTTGSIDPPPLQAKLWRGFGWHIPPTRILPDILLIHQRVQERIILQCSKLPANCIGCFSLPRIHSEHGHSCVPQVTVLLAGSVAGCMGGGNQRAVGPREVSGCYEYPTRSGNEVELLVDGIAVFSRIAQAVRAAHTRVWVAVAFIASDFTFPDTGETTFQLLQAAHERGIEVRALFWSNPEFPTSIAFPWSEKNVAWLRKSGYTFPLRWDPSPDAAHCHHQKSWVIDAGTEHCVSFVGGLNLEPGELVTPQHMPAALGGNVHDTYMQIRGPASADVAHNLATRWNGIDASRLHCYPSAEAAPTIKLPAHLGVANAGDVTLQIARTMCRDWYTGKTPVVDPPRGWPAPEPMARGRCDIFRGYVEAIRAATSVIYIENQYIADDTVLDELSLALSRGVAVLYIVPQYANSAVMAAARRAAAYDRAVMSGEAVDGKRPRYQPTFEAIRRLGRWPNFTLCGIASNAKTNSSKMRYHPIYVHSKLCVIDDKWGSLGSANLVDISLQKDHSELNVTWTSERAARQARVALFQEHAGIDTSDMTIQLAVRTVITVAEANTQRRKERQPMQGHVFMLAAETYPFISDAEDSLRA